MRIATVGDNVVDIYPTLGLMFPGGNAVNVAVNASRNGAEACYVGAIGTEERGRIVENALQSERVDIGRLRRVSGPNAWAEVLTEGGERIFHGSDPGVSRFELDEADLDYLRGSSLIHTSIYSGMESRLADLATVAPLSMDFSDRQLAHVYTWLPDLSLAAFSVGAAGAGEAEGLARAARALGPRTILVSCGSAGVTLLVDRALHTAAAPPITPLDTLGAGDALIGALLVSLVEERAPQRALEESVEKAEETCMHLGAIGHQANIK